MKKIIIADRLKQAMDAGLLEELMDHEVFTAYSNEDVVKIHRKEKADLIVTELFGSGMNAIQCCALLREAEDLRGVSVIVYCRDNEIERSEASRCRANAVLALPIRGTVLRQKVEELLHIPSRGRYHARFSARHESGKRPEPIDCRAQNISVTGMLIESDAELSHGDRLRYSLLLAPERSFSMQAEVVRTDIRPAGPHRKQYGIRFSRIDPATRRAIEVLISQSPQAL